MLINILDLFKDFFFTDYLFMAMVFLGVMLCLRKLVFNR